ncbi:2-keto-4-pentenoate hydratase [Brevibacillus daliensis]|uniref:2-keto-4-pentenoate hydratase n=1 Tax=Brevibacillus daliensis TaxID=2892995 RepID=UPI001E45B928|nr:fumarylacetoacetate hydrolase family protein [Brevibacillus daliensis]
MSITQDMAQDIVTYLYEAEKECKEVTKVTDRYPDLQIEEAYNLQDQLIERKIQDGNRRIGIKLGLTSEAKQKMMGVHEAIYGTLLHDMLAYEWEPIDCSQLIHPKAEPEIAFFMAEDLQGTNVTAEDVLQATQFVAAAIEIIDSRYENFRFTLTDVVADNCSSARFVIGSKMVSPQELNLVTEGMVMSKNGEIAATGTGAAVLGNPATAVAWAVNKLGERGAGLKKGDIVLAGAMSEAIAIGPGDHVLVQFDGLGSVSLTGK